jgi:hypothetical protein
MAIRRFSLSPSSRVDLDVELLAAVRCDHEHRQAYAGSKSSTFIGARSYGLSPDWFGVRFRDCCLRTLLWPKTFCCSSPVRCRAFRRSSRRANRPTRSSWISPARTTIRTTPIGRTEKIITLHQNEFNIFIKDQIAYQLPGNSLSRIGSDVGSNPGQTYQPTDLGRGSFRDFSNVVIPPPNDARPQQSGGTFGNFFGQQYQRISDPACAAVASNLRVRCTITALADANGNIVLQNARPGQLGTLGLKSIHGPGSWDFDANIQKSIRIEESKNLTLRVDAQNVFNHPTPGNPNLNIDSGTFGEIASKTGSRTL